MNIKSISMNETVKSIAKDLSEKDRKRNFTNVTNYEIRLKTAGNIINKDDYITFFKQLDANGFGKVIYGRNGNDTWFNWNYFLKDVGRALLNVDKDVIIHKLDNQDSPKPKTNVVKKPIILGSEVVFMYKSLDGEVIPIKLTEADRLIEQVKAIKDKLV